LDKQRDCITLLGERTWINSQRTMPLFG
jgi:hypothetical protein